MVTRGVVREWWGEEGCGVVDSADTPGGCWTHYSQVAIPGFRELHAGQAVELEWEAPGQDGFPFRALRVWPRGLAPYDEPGTTNEEPTAAYHSKLTVTHSGTEGVDAGPGASD